MRRAGAGRRNRDIELLRHLQKRGIGALCLGYEPVRDHDDPGERAHSSSVVPHAARRPSWRIPTRSQYCSV